MDLLGFILRVCHLDGVNANVWGLDDFTIQPSPNVSCKIILLPPPPIYWLDLIIMIELRKNIGYNGKVLVEKDD
jgi:hypothetical protein